MGGPFIGHIASCSGSVRSSRYRLPPQWLIVGRAVWRDAHNPCNKRASTEFHPNRFSNLSSVQVAISLRYFQVRAIPDLFIARS